jgi:alpha-tubulin suppressor-like RCC1 family protein
VSIAQYAYSGGCAISSDNALICFSGADLTPSQVDTGTFRQVTNGTFVRCAIATSGKLYCMGQSNNYGQLGTGDTDPHAGLTPVKTDATNWRYVTTSSNHTCALDETGALYCWGYGATGALGDGGGDGGNQYYVSVPQQVEPGTVYVDVDAKSSSTCAVTSEGALTCTGGSYYYGSASKTMKTLDTASDWAKVRLGASHACALKRTGKIYCWGYNNNGQIGQPPSLTVATSPQQVGTDNNWVDVAVGDDFSCGRKADGSVRCWGSNGANQLGQADSGHLTPKLVGSAGEWKYVGAGASSVCAVKTDGSLFCWGNNAAAGLGARNQVPVQVGTSKAWETVVTTGDRACGTQTGGALYCWGSSFGNTSPSAVGYSNVTSVALGAEHQCFISAGSLYCWGDGIFGKLCNGGSDEAAPKAVPTNTYLAVAAGDEDTCAVQSDGTMHCCGFGYGTLEKIGDATSWTSTAVAVNGEDYFGLQGTGALYTWSWIDDVAASGTIVDWKSFVVGAGHRCGIRADNSLSCFGSNNAGQLGDGTTTSKSAPVQVGDGKDWSQVAVGGSFTCGLRGNDLYCWGDNSQGQIGDGSAWSVTPVVVQ